MIDQSVFNGGAKFTTIAGTHTLYSNSERVQRINNTTGSTQDVFLPAPELFRSNQAGGPRFYIINESTSTGSLRIRYVRGGSSTITLKTITAGQVVVVLLVDTTSASGSYAAIVRTVGAARSSYHSTRATIENPTEPATYDPFCFEGSACDLASVLGNTPLDGVDGRDLVIAPMFEDVIRFAKNQGREPIRAADVVMPKIVVVSFDPEGFTADAAHPLASTVLPEEFYTALYQAGGPHGLEYDGPANGTSRHWHHIRWSGTSPVWVLGSLSVRRHVWKKVIEYTSNGTTYEIELRFVMEHTVNPEPVLEPDGTGGSNNRTAGAWGALFMLYVFTNQLSPSFADGDSYTPAGGSSAVTFTKDDPCAWGSAPSVSGGGTDDKFCHPQMVLCACLPTTFQAPFGSAYVPWDERKWLRSVGGGFIDRGLNREYCYLTSNGAPWSVALSGSCTNPAPYGVGIMGNVVFGFTVSTTSGACMTTGGAFAGSKPTEWLTFENGRGVGRTYLQPLKPGWDEACGELVLDEGNSGTISICIDDEWGVDDGSGYKKWPSFEFSGCSGHPDEPFEDIGGSHVCFKNTDSATTLCCVAVAETLAVANERCQRVTDVWGDFNGTDCDPLDSLCENGGSWGTSYVLEVEDYDYIMNGNQDLRAISWVRYLRDPATTQLFSYTYDSADVADFTQVVGTFNLGSTITVTSAGASPLRSLLRYQPASSVYRDVSVQATAKKATQASHGVMVHEERVSGSENGLVFIITPTGSTNATCVLKRYDSGTATTLASKNITNLTSDTVALSIEKWGTEVTVAWQVLGEDPDALDLVQICDFDTGGGVCLVSESNSTNVEFDDFVVDDKSITLNSVAGSLSKSSVSIGFPETLMSGYGKCESTVNPTCGDAGPPPDCNCKHTVEGMVRVTTASHAGPGDIVASDCPTPGDNPTWYGGESPANCVCAGPDYGSGGLPCNDCPGPFPALSLAIPTRCGVVSSDAEPKMCLGITYYWWEEVV